MADRTPDEIEREIEAERAALTRSLDALQRELSPDVLIDKATAKLREHGGSVAETALRQARQNPMAMAVTGLGLAWLAAGPATGRRRTLRLPPPKPSSRIASPARPASPSEYRAGSSLSPGSTAGRHPPVAPRPIPAYDNRTYERATGFRGAADPMAGFDDRLARTGGDETDPTIKERIGDAMASAKERLMSLKTRLADAAHDPKTTARELRDYLSEGTEQMSQATRERVMAARQAAWDAEKRLEAHARDYADAGREFYGSQPLIGGLVAFGLGAAIGAALPRTRQENHYLGSYRDRAVDEAERFYRSESDRLRSVAEDAVEEAKRLASETLDNVASEAKGATSRAEGKLDEATSGASDMKSGTNDMKPGASNIKSGTDNTKFGTNDTKTGTTGDKFKSEGTGSKKV